MNADELKEKIEKLPKWAHEYIFDLDLSRKRLAKQLAEIDSGGTTNIRWELSFTEGEHFIPNDAHLYFYTSPTHFFSLLFKEGSLWIYGNGMPIKLLPGGNSIGIEIDK